MTERPRRTNALADWENEGGRVDTGPRHREVTAATSGRGSAAPAEESNLDGRSTNREKQGGQPMNTKALTITGILGLVVGVGIGGVWGAWVERRSNDERMAAAVQVLQREPTWCLLA